MAMLLILGGSFIAAVLVYYLFASRRIPRPHLQTSKSLQSTTPPQSISPVKEKRFAAITNAIPALSLKTVLPPSRRGSLGFGLTTPICDDAISPVAYSKIDVDKLGDFPDYAAITGVPLPKPYLEFDIDKALPRPYRPFRWAYHQTMSLTKMEPDWWLELESTYVERITQRVGLFEAHGKEVLDMQPGSELACKELMEMCVQFVCARYPQYFHLDPITHVLTNKILSKTFSIRDMEPLHVVLHNIPEDFAIVLPDMATGKYVFRAGCICSSLGWSVATKINKTLAEIHGGIVPDYKEKMSMSMDRYFTKMPADKPIQRGSWGIEHGEPLFLPAGHPGMALRQVQSPNLTLSDINLRVDWQTLRRLPLSNGIVFNFKALFTPITEFRDEPCMPALVLKVLKEGKKNLMEYKGTWHIEHVALPTLEEWKREQEENGLCEVSWEVRTLDEAPYFKGWEGKWKRQQGF